LIEIRALLKNIATDKTVLFSTHIMQEVVELCDTVVFLQAGEIKQQCNRAEIEQGSAHLERLFSA
jgi:ABC-2 type transport system ATP-binding protein